MKKGPLVVPSGCLSARVLVCPPTIGICCFSSFFSSRARFSGLGWGGVGMLTFLALAHMFYATPLLHTCSMLRHSCTHVRCYATLAHMFDATSLLHTCSMLRHSCTHVRCYAIGCLLHLHTYLMLRHRMFLVGLGWGGVGMLTFLALADMFDATP